MKFVPSDYLATILLLLASINTCFQEDIPEKPECVGGPMTLHIPPAANSTFDTSKCMKAIEPTDLVVRDIQSGRAPEAYCVFLRLPQKELLLEGVITQAYENKAENADNIMRFVDMLDMKEQVTSITVLYGAMLANKDVNNSQVFIIGVKINKLLKSKDISVDLQEELSKTFQLFSPVVRNVVTSSRASPVTLTSPAFNGETVFIDGTIVNKGLMYVFMNRNNAYKMKSDKQSLWFFETSDGGRKFAISSIWRSVYIHLPRDNIFVDYNNRLVGANTKFSMGRIGVDVWVLIANEKQTGILLKSSIEQEYMYPLDNDTIFDSEKRQVVSFRNPHYEAANDPNFEWQVNSKD